MAFDVQIGNLAAVLLVVLSGIITLKEELMSAGIIFFVICMAYSALGIFCREMQYKIVKKGELGDRGGFFSIVFLSPLIIGIPIFIFFSNKPFFLQYHPFLVILYFSLGYSGYGLSHELIEFMLTPKLRNKT